MNQNPFFYTFRRSHLWYVCFLATILSVASCKKDTDNSPPKITLNGNQVENIFLQSTYTDPGAIAIDDQDGVVNVTVSGSFNVNKTGTYYLTYTATDGAGNAASASRQINVSNELTSSSWNANYTCEKDSAGMMLYQYTDSLGFSNTLNNQMAFMKFGDLSNADALFNILITGTAIDPYNQTITAGTPPVSVNYAGAGITNSGPPDQLILTVTETTASDTVDYTYVMTKN